MARSVNNCRDSTWPPKEHFTRKRITGVDAIRQSVLVSDSLDTARSHIIPKCLSVPRNCFDQKRHKAATEPDWHPSKSHRRARENGLVFYNVMNSQKKIFFTAHDLKMFKTKNSEKYGFRGKVSNVNANSENFQMKNRRSVAVQESFVANWKKKEVLRKRDCVFFPGFWRWKGKYLECL